MYGLKYSRLLSITKTVAPYRGNVNRFPIGHRRHNTKYFLVREENHEKVFDIVIGTNWYSKEFTKEEYEAMDEVDRVLVRTYPVYDPVGVGKIIPDEFIYIRYYTVPHIIGVVRPDNTFEFTTSKMHQGVRVVLSGYSQGWLHSDSRRGGVVYKERHGVFHPIYKGMRVYCDSMTPTVPYVVQSRYVNRKVGKELLAGYVDMFKTTEVMLKAMEWKTFVDTMKEVVDEHFEGRRLSISWDTSSGRIKSDEYLDKAKELTATAPLDAFMMFALAFDVDRMQWNIQHADSTRSWNDTELPQLFMAVKRRFSKEMYKKTPDVFTDHPQVTGRKYPANEWGVRVEVNGKEVEQYS
jgi:hypothetical protein